MENVLELLEASAARSPGKTAVADEEGSLTFAELAALSRRIGAALPRGAGQGEPVGVMAGRSRYTLAFFFAALYSGNWYVPLDPAMPAEKLGGILAETGMRAVLAREEDRAALAAAGYAGRVYSQEDAGEEELSLPACGGDDPMYMVYTSGSTGKPKGILKSHAAQLRYLEAACAAFGFTGEEIVGNQTPFFFDASAKDIGMMMRCGCTLEIIPSRLFSFPADLVDYLNARRVSFISWVPSALGIVAQLNTFSVVTPAYLRDVFFVGEVMPVKYLNAWRKALPEARFVNLYGQSEIAGVCCWYQVLGEMSDTDTLPIGRPLPCCRVRLMDGQEEISQPGRTGEIVLSGGTLALGYYRDPERTAASFGAADGAGAERSFRTGDMARWNERGELVFASRADGQIKHMGHRIELGEIEAAALALPQVRRCCCLYQAERQRIVLFCETAPGAETTGREIRAALRSRLSDYMVPRQVVLLEHLPLTPNGKTDRQALRGQLEAQGGK